MDINLEKKRIQILLFIVGIIALSIIAEKSRQMVGEEAASKSGQFTFLNCFDMGTGSVACSVKEGVKLYVNSFQSAHVELVRSQAMEKILNEAISQGVPVKDAAKQATKEGKKAAKLASRQARRITGPIVSSGWDFFEAIYFGGSMTEGFLRGGGTLVGTYGAGFIGEQRLGRIGYLVGSQVGSWVGGRIGLMLYDVVNGINYLLQFDQTQSEVSEYYESQQESEVSQFYESQQESEVSQVYESQQESEVSQFYESQQESDVSQFYESQQVYESDEL